MLSPLSPRRLDCGTPTFRSIYHFPILPQLQVIRDYHRLRRLGDAALSNRQQATDIDFEKSQEELARSRYIVREKTLPKPSNTKERTSPRGELRRQPLPRYPSKVNAHKDESSLSLVRTKISSHSRWSETFVLVFLLCTTLLLCAPSSLEQLPRSRKHCPAADTRYFEVTGYELVPDIRRWGRSQPPLVFLS